VGAKELRPGRLPVGCRLEAVPPQDGDVLEFLSRDRRKEMVYGSEIRILTAPRGLKVTVHHGYQGAPLSGRLLKRFKEQVVLGELTVSSGWVEERAGDR
jgi:hypothetical protein